MDLEQSLSVTVRTTRAVYLVVERSHNIEALVRSLASLLPKPVHVFRLESDFLHPGDGQRLVDPLMRGETVLVLRMGPSGLPASFADKWIEYLEHPAGTLLTVARNLTLKPNADLTSPGFLALAHIGPGQGERPRKAHQLWVAEEDIAGLERERASVEVPIARLGVASPSAEGDMSMKALCLLHERDPVGTPRRPSAELLNDETHAITWTDLQTLLRVAKEDVLETLRHQGRIDEEKYGFGLAALHSILQGTREGPRGTGIYAHPDIYDVVWRFAFLEGANTIFRGQFDTRWGLECSLLRREPDGEPLTVKTLIERVSLTEAFLAELRERQQKIFGKSLDEHSLLAIAQHFGFPTPLLDYTSSLRIAAFFATSGARKLPEGEKATGVIYHMDLSYPKRLTVDPGETSLKLFELAGIRLGTPQLIKPDIPDSDNRIRRQSGLFVDGFRARDLQEISIDRIYFRQQPGVVFEDQRAGVDENTLLPDRTELTELAKLVCEQFKHTRTWQIHEAVGKTALAEESILGSEGSLLYAQLRESQEFMTALHQKASAVGGAQAVSDVNKILSGYFHAARLEAAVGTTPQEDQQGPAFKPIAQAVSDLAEWSGAVEEQLWQVVHKFLPGGRDQEQGANPEELPEIHPASERERIAFACAFYLGGWDYLRHVDGERAGKLVFQAQLMLEGPSTRTWRTW